MTETLRWKTAWAKVCLAGGIAIALFALALIDRGHNDWWLYPLIAAAGWLISTSVDLIIVAAAYYTGRGMIDAAVLQQEKRDRGLEP